MTIKDRRSPDLNGMHHTSSSASSNSVNDRIMSSHTDSHSRGPRMVRKEKDDNIIQNGSIDERKRDIYDSSSFMTDGLTITSEDDRINMDIEDEEEDLQIILKNAYAQHCIYLPFMAGWFLFSSLLSTYNTYIFSSGRMHFPCPLTLTSIHFLMQWMLSFSLSNAWPEYFGNERITSMSWSEFLSISIPCGVVTALDVGLSNLSLVRINLTFYTMVKASAPIFVLLFAVLFGLEKLSWGLVCVVLLISAGELIVCAYGDLDFDLFGFMCILSATICSGMRWTLVQFKLKTLDPPLKSSIATMRILSPSMAVTLIIIAIIVEQPWTKLAPSHSIYFDTFEHGFRTTMLGVIGGTLAVAMVWFEFCLIMRSSAMILMIGGVLKELITIFLGAEIFGDNVNAKNLSGCAVVFSGVILYKYLFHMGNRNEELPDGRDSNSNNEDRSQDYSKVALAEVDDVMKSSRLSSSARQRRYNNSGSSRGSNSDEETPRII